MSRLSCGDYYIRRVLDWQLDLLDHTQLHKMTVYTLYNSLQFTLTIAGSSHCIFTGCLSSTGSCSPSELTCNSLDSTARPHTRRLTDWAHTPRLTDWCSNTDWLTVKVKVTLRPTTSQSVSKSWFQGPWGSHDLIFISVDIYECCFIDYGRPLWRKVGSVICHSHCPSIVSKYIPWLTGAPAHFI
jgi:hypothetical protein